MDSQQNFFIILFIFLSFLIWQLWESNDKRLLEESTQKIPDNNLSSIDINYNKNEKRKIISVATDVLLLKINVYGGDIEEASLLKYPDELKSKIPFQLLQTNPNFIYQAQSGITGPDGPDNPYYYNSRPLFSSEKSTYFLEKNQNILEIPMYFTNKDGVRYIKTFVLKRGEYDIQVKYDINNLTEKKIKIAIFNQLKQTKSSQKKSSSYSNFVLQTFHGAAYSTDTSKYKKYKFEKIINDKNLNTITKTGWIAMIQQYFVTAWVPNNIPGEKFFYTSNLNNKIVSIGYKSNLLTINPYEKKILNSTIWIGPEIQNKMSKIAPYLDLTVDYGWLWFISQPLFKLLKFLYNFIGNWGFSIVLITFIVRFLMYPLTKVQYTSAAKMRILQPKIQAIQEKFKDNKQRLSHELINFYKLEKVNPLGGCLPLLIQMPIFLALYYMLVSSVELRHAPFIFWIHDLSEQDPYYILPILMGITMFFIQKMTPSSVSDPLQKKVMTFMPFIFIIFFLWFPSGLVLYYIISNLVTILQQQLIYHTLEKHNQKYKYEKK